MARKTEAQLQEWRDMGMEIGEGCRILGGVEKHHPHWVHIGDRVLLGDKAAVITHGPIRPFGENVHIYIEDLVYIGRRSVILPGSRIGRGSIVGTMSVIAKEFPPYHTIAGNPARAIRPLTGFELLRYYNCRFLMDRLNTPEIDWSNLTRDDVLWVLGLPRDTLFDNDPAAPLIENGYEDMTLEEMLGFYGIDPAKPSPGVTEI